MTQEEIVEMARESGMELYGLGRDRAKFVHYLTAFANLVAAKEREECAKVCEEHPDGMNMLGGAYIACAKAIRARGEQA